MSYVDGAPDRSLEYSRRLTISEPRFYTDEEVAPILRSVAESPDSPVGIRASSSGISREQIKVAAAEAGLDPSAVERVALRLTKQEPVSFLERVAGGPRRLRANIHLPVLDAVRESTPTAGDGGGGKEP